jgi:hypothetical protein
MIEATGAQTGSPVPGPEPDTQEDSTMAKFLLAYRGGGVPESEGKGCPVLAGGGTVDVYEAMDMG